MTAPLSTIWRPVEPYDLALTIGSLRRGGSDPSTVPHDGAWWHAFRTPAGPVTLRVHQSREGIHAHAWGPGSQEALAGVPRMLGGDDDWSGFDHPTVLATLPEHVRLARQRHPGLRLLRTGRVLEVLIPAILEQKVTGKEAFAGYRRLVALFGEAAPGLSEPGGYPPAQFPPGLRLGPEPQTWARIPSWAWHQAGVGPQRSDTIMRALQRASALGRLGQVDAPTASRALQSISGIGRWTAAEVTQISHGDPDSVSVGDYHLAGFVGLALIGEPVDDAGMLELLEPWRGNRQRVVRLLGLTGIRKERHGPRMSVRDYRRF
ncbi:DNA-3-methyladenine glycosylase family protein [Psychromicrobium xiongbiense]|uniref:DNA-3-methyladenine glycosylase family protein n=1 Tax=Psychromicrobium xiongbiense TaxID=3051184 RepID=UPI0025554E3F|nr:3-methyladenine DNA glycosylase [Psychromicrobium sp. YIM S02556]